MAQGWRSDAYRALLASSTEDTHLLAIDYRGFGYSTGFPTEQGLITDGIAAVYWALNVARVPEHKIVIVGHSLGTAVAAAVAEHFSHDAIEFGGVVLYAGFTSLPDLLSDYCLVGWLFPLRLYPRLLKYFTESVLDKWPTADRIGSLARVSKHIRLYIVHSLNDYEIRPHHSAKLRFAAVDAVRSRMGYFGFMATTIAETILADPSDGAFTVFHDLLLEPNTLIIEYSMPYGCTCFVHSICSVSANTPQIIA